MATFPYTQILLGFMFLLFLFHWSRNRSSVLIKNWTLIGMLPGLPTNLSRVHHNVTQLLKQNGGTFEFKGPWFCNLDFLLTCDPVNTNHVLSKSFSNYSKGPEFGMIFEPLGDGILAAESESWKFQRKLTHSYVKDTKFKLFLEKTIQEKVVNGLIPVLEHVCSEQIEVNLEDVFQRLGFDIICLLVLGCDPKCLSEDFPQVPYKKAFSEMEEAVLYRHVVPVKYWKLLKWLQIGQEKKLTTALKIIDDFVYQCIAAKKEKYLQSTTNQHQETEFDFLTAYLMQEEDQEFTFIRDMAFNLVAAGSETTSAALSWFFWILSKNPSVERKILEEINQNLQPKEEAKPSYIFSTDAVNTLVYLHAALCETLRLYPPVPINHKCSVVSDTLPSGHHVKANTKIFISFYAMGRMEEIWGKDWREFKPERWILEDGGIVHVPSYKFTAFNAGPRSCLGKDLSFIQMKIVAVAIILKYQVWVVEDDLVFPSSSVILHMKHGLKVTVTKRCMVET